MIQGRIHEKQKAVRQMAQLTGHRDSPLYTPPLTKGKIVPERHMAKAPTGARVAAVGQLAPAIIVVVVYAPAIAVAVSIIAIPSIP